MVRRILLYLFTLIIVFSSTGCQATGLTAKSNYKPLIPDKLSFEDKYTENLDSIPSDKSKKAEVISSVDTAFKEVAVTFDGMGDESSVLSILNQLDKLNIKATFFLPGERVAEEPEIAREIVKRGHYIGNNTLNRLNLTNLDYADIYKGIYLSHDVIVKETGIEPKFLRTRFGYYNDEVCYAAAQSGYENIITYSINPQDWDMKSAQQIADIVDKRLSKGSIIILNTDKNKEVANAIPLIYKVIADRGYKIVSLEQLQKGKLPEVKVPVSGGKSESIRMLDNVTYSYTTRPQMALTFDGLGNRNIMQRILEQLDREKIKATFFIPGIRAAEEPELVKEIVNRGHTVEDNTFQGLDMTRLSYDEIYRDLKLSQEYIEKASGKVPKYVRPEFGKVSDALRKAAAQCGYQSLVTYSIYPQDKNMKSARDIADVVEKAISRGRIIDLKIDNNPEIVDAIPLIAKVMAGAGQKLVSLDVLLQGQYERLPVDKIPGYYIARINSDYQNTAYRQVTYGSRESKMIALTFDDWANDEYLTKTLEVLKKYNVKSTFFLRANGVERTPNLARLIFEEGHEVANHSYNHKVSTDLTPEELQTEVVKCHQILSQYLGQSPVLYFRPPTGVIDELHSKAVAATGYKAIVLYDVSPQDWRPEKTVDDIVNATLKDVQPGANVVLHLQDSMKTSQALEIIIQRLSSQGYKFVTVSDLIK